MPRYALLIYSVEEDWDTISPDERQGIMGEYIAISSSPGVTGGAQLDDVATATTVRVANGEAMTTDGPFIETKEALGGFFLLEAADLDDAIALAARVPAARRGGAVEIRPLVENV